MCVAKCFVWFQSDSPLNWQTQLESDFKFQFSNTKRKKITKTKTTTKAKEKQKQKKSIPDNFTEIKTVLNSSKRLLFYVVFARIVCFFWIMAPRISHEKQNNCCVIVLYWVWEKVILIFKVCSTDIMTGVGVWICWGFFFSSRLDVGLFNLLC